jgi:3-oxoacyl-[acyl-carrier-protein] synthase-1
MSPSRPVYIRQTGHVSALGLCAAEAAAALLAGKRNISQRNLLGTSYPWFALPLAEQDWTERARRALALLAAELAAETSPGELAHLPLFVGTSTHATGAIEAAAQAAGIINNFFDNEYAIFIEELNLAFHRTNNPEPPYLFATACTSGIAALEAAFTLIAQGDMDEALVLGIEFASNTSLAGFASLGLIADSENGEGFVLGEAAAGLWLTSRPGPGWRIAACRLCIDGYAPTLPTPDGQIIAANINAALKDAGLAASDIGFIKPHLCGLPGTDEAEEAALSLVFEPPRPPAAYFKRQIGHTLGACGPAELTALLALLDSPAGQARYGTVQRLLFSLAGFGGSMAALIAERSFNAGEPA